MKKLFLIALLAVVGCQMTMAQCPEALKAYAARYPEAQPEDLYKLVFQDLYGPGHLLTDSAAAMRYIGSEVQTMSAEAYSFCHGPFEAYEYTLCDSNFVRVNLVFVKLGVFSLEQFISAVLRSTEGMVAPDHRFVMSHSQAFKTAYDPHYRIIRRDIFEREFLPAIIEYIGSHPVPGVR